MARKPRSFFEPWVAKKSAAHGPDPFPDGIPETDDGLAARIRDGWFRADDHASYYIWGTGVAEPTVCKQFSGDIVVMDDAAILIGVHRNKGIPKGGPDQADIARRVADCVNACEGIADPESFVAGVRELLLRMCRGEDVGNKAPVSLLGKCIPLRELEESSHPDDAF